MGKEKEALRVVLDTNILISSLLFSGELARIVELWKSGRIVPVISKETFAEFRAVLGYPKFRLTAEEIRTIIEDEVLPYFDVVEITEKVKGVCRDPGDDKFLACALSGSVNIVVSGDEDLSSLRKYRGVRIIRASELMDMLK